jgi:hypothetical protein
MAARVRRGIFGILAADFDARQSKWRRAMRKDVWSSRCDTTRRAMLTGAAMLPALSLPAVAGNSADAEIVDLARRLIAGIEAEYPLRLALEAAWAASEGVRRQLLADHPRLQDEQGQVQDLTQRTAQGRRRAVAYDRWNEVCRECSAISERILAQPARTGPGLAAHVLAYYYVERGAFSQSKGGALLRAAAAMLGEKLPASLDADIQEELDRVVQARADVP